MQVVWTTPAVAALERCAIGIAAENPTAALRAADAIRGATDRLAQFPAMGRPGRVPGTRELVVGGTRYIVAYAVSDTRVVILHVQHDAQMWPGGWRVSDPNDNGEAS